MGDTAYTSGDRVGAVEAELIEEDDSYVEEEDFEAQGFADSPARKMALGGAVLLLFAVFGLVIWLLASRNGTTAAGGDRPPGQGVGPQVGAFAPDFELVNVRTNQPLKLSSLRGKPVFINFWGTWCPPCRAEMPEMQRFYDNHKNEIEVVGVSLAPRDWPEQVKTFVDQANYSWVFVHDEDQSVSMQYQAFSIPSSYFIDKDGVVRGVKVGAFLDSAEMERYLDRAR